MRTIVGFVLITALFTLARPQEAAAGNGLHPRTPVDWTGAPCMTIIDRSRGPAFELVYTIPYEDTEITVDEVANSRTHQFFGFCRDHHREELLPSWIAQADLVDADAHGLGDAGMVDTTNDVLDAAPSWAGCFTRITSDAERRPITFAAAADPVTWDTSGLAAGTWVVEGYTYEPWTNAWWPHPGVFKIVDDPDPAASGPAAALTFPELLITQNETATITGCVDAMPGATMTASWAISGFGSELDWQVFAADVDASSGAFELDWTPTLETVSNTVLIKLEVSDPLGRSWTAHANNYIAVTEDLGETGCEDGGGFVSDPCEDTGTDDGGATETGAETSGAGETSLGAEPPTDAGSCSCSTPAPDSGPGWLGLLGALGLLGLAGRRRGAQPG